MKTLFILLVSGWVPLTSLAQASVLQWQKFYANRNRPEDALAAFSINNNGIVVSGRSYTPQMSGSVNANPQGTLWFYNQRGDSIRTVFPVPATPNELLVIQGLASLPNGDLLMSAGGFDKTQTAFAAQQASSALVLTRTDSVGNVRWTRRYNPGIVTSGATITSLPDGGALLTFVQAVGTSIFNALNYAHVARVDSLGNMLWQQRYGRAGSQLLPAVPMPDGSYALAGLQGRANPQGGLIYNAWFLHLTATGDTLRNRYWGSATEAVYIDDIRATPGGGVLLAGTRHLTQGGISLGWLTQLDAQDRTTWHYELRASATNPALNTYLNRLAVLQNGDFLLHGSRDQTGMPPGYLARWSPPAPGSTAPTPVWEVQLPGTYVSNLSVLSSDGSLTLGSRRADPSPPRYDHTWLRHYASQGLPFQADLCATPPVPNAAALLPAPDSLRAIDLGNPGPQYAQLVRWRWSFGDGSSAERLTQGYVAHRYAQPPPAGTPVTVTITNNLGCTATQTLYPFGAPSATQQQRALAAALTLWPNPATATVTVRLPGLRPQPPVPAEAVDALGRVVARFALPVRAGAGEAVLDVSPWPAGVYALRLWPVEGVVAKRFVKQ